MSVFLSAAHYSNAATCSCKNFITCSVLTILPFEIFEVLLYIQREDRIVSISYVNSALSSTTALAPQRCKKDT
jgi:hypothetical protein